MDIEGRTAILNVNCTHKRRTRTTSIRIEKTENCNNKNPTTAQNKRRKNTTQLLMTPNDLIIIES